MLKLERQTAEPIEVFEEHPRFAMVVGNPPFKEPAPKRARKATKGKKGLTAEIKQGLTSLP